MAVIMSDHEIRWSEGQRERERGKERDRDREREGERERDSTRFSRSPT